MATERKQRAGSVKSSDPQPEAVRKTKMKKQAKKRGAKKESAESKKDETLAGEEKTAGEIKGRKKKGKDIKEIVKRQLTILMNKGASEAVRVSAAKSLMDIIYRQQEVDDHDAVEGDDGNRDAAEKECAALLAELATRLAARPSRKVAMA